MGASLLLLGWTTLIVVSASLSIDHLRTTVEEIAQSAGAASLERDVRYREWTVQHGGVYVAATADTPPNPRLAGIPERDVVTPSGRVLTLVNPDDLLTHVGVLEREGRSHATHVTSLTPRRPENAPDAWERRALGRISSGEPEVTETATAGGVRSLRIMRPLFAEAGCVRCHPDAAGASGRILGGISLAVPLDAIERAVALDQRTQVVSHSVLWVLGTIVLGLYVSLVRKNEANRVTATDELRSRDAILDAVHVAAARFLASADWRLAIDDVLARLGEAADASRVVIFTCEHTPSDTLISQRHEWAGAGRSLRVNDPSLSAIPLRAGGFTRWLETLSRGETIEGHVRDFPASERVALAAHDIRSIVVAPIAVDGQLWGFIAFDQCETERMWSPAEADALRAAARIISGALARERIEQALRAQDRFVSAVMRHSPDYIAVIDLAQEREIYRNKPLERLLGYPSADPDALPRGLLHFAHADHVEPLHAHLERCAHAADDEVVELEHRLLRSTGHDTWMFLRFTVVERGHDGAATRVLCVAQDVTTARQSEVIRAQLEEQLRQAQKLEAIGQLAGGIAHDFNNLLTIILGNCSVLETLPSYMSEERQAVRDVEDSANRATALTRQLLAFSRRQAMRVRSLDVNGLLEGLVALLGRVIGEHITVECQFEPGLPPIEGDSTMLEQVVLNLVVNARDAMPDGGRITLRTNAVEVSSTDGHPADARIGRHVALSVHDTGTGFAPDAAKHLFEPFFTTKELGRGTGLGLSTVYGIVRQHEGWIEAVSQPGQGATFTVYFPVGHMGTLTRPESSSTAPVSRGGRETILVVEDELSVRRLVVSSLRSLGYQMLEAHNGPDALKVAREHPGPIDLLFSDQVMPERMSGRELAEQLRSERPGLKVILTSGYSRALVEEPLTDIAFLLKPFDQPSLCEVVRRVLDT